MSFLEDYSIYSSGNEAPKNYHLFSSIVALSSIISRRVWYDQSYFTVYPNIYVVLVGPPGARKSTAIGIAKGLLHRLPDVAPFSGECTSKEKLVQDMAENCRVIDGLPEQFADKRAYSPMTIMVSELSELFQISADNMVGFLTDVFDISFPYEHKTKNKGTVKIEGPFLSILAGTTPSWMTTYLRSDIISGGFTRRCLFVYEDNPTTRIAEPELTNEQRNAWARVHIAAQRISKIKGPFTRTPEARDFYRNWYETLKIPTDPNTQGYYQSKHVQLLKLAMLHALSEREELVLTVPDLEKGLYYLSLIEDNLPRVFEGMGSNSLNASSSRFLDLLRRAPVISYKDPLGNQVSTRGFPRKYLEAAMFSEVDARQFDEILAHLINTERVRKASMSDNGITREYILLKCELKDKTIKTPPTI